MSGSPPVDSDASSFPEIGTDRPQSARIYNYWLGGKDHYPVDREMGEQIRAVLPGIPEMARCQRAFLVRVVTFLAREVGIRQFLDIGTGLPTANNTHEVAQAVAPESRIVYVDNDPIVLYTLELCSPAQARARPPTSTPTCATPTGSWTRPPRPWISPSPLRSCCWGSCTTSPIPTRQTPS
jgi:S-adenosyl methyltransferase